MLRGERSIRRRGAAAPRPARSCRALRCQRRAPEGEPQPAHLLFGRASCGDVGAFQHGAAATARCTPERCGHLRPRVRSGAEPSASDGGSCALALRSCGAAVLAADARAHCTARSSASRSATSRRSAPDASGASGAAHRSARHANRCAAGRPVGSAAQRHLRWHALGATLKSEYALVHAAIRAGSQLMHRTPFVFWDAAPRVARVECIFRSLRVVSKY